MIPRRRTVRPLLQVLSLPLALLLVAAPVVGAQRVNPVGGAPAPPRVASTLGVIDGAVTDTALRPVAMAEIAILRTDIKLQTNSSGRFRFVDVPAGQYLLIVRRLGYRPISAIIEVARADTVRLSYTLEPVTHALDRVVITEERRSLRMMEFEERRRQGQGFFITQDMIEKRNLPVSADYLRLSTTVALAPSHNNSGISDLVAVSKREAGSIYGDGAGACAMQIVIDGVPMPPRFPLELLPNPRELAGIEIYSGPATVPAQFSGLDRRCGMIIFWTRDGY